MLRPWLEAVGSGRLAVNDPHVPSYEFRRGFIEALSCTAAAWLAHADALTAAAPIRAVRLTTWPMAERVGRHHGGMPWNARFRWRLPGRRREVTSGNSAAEVGEMLLRTTWRKIAFTLPPVATAYIGGQYLGDVESLGFVELPETTGVVPSDDVGEADEI